MHCYLKDKNSLINFRISKIGTITSKNYQRSSELNVFSTQHPLPVKHSLEVKQMLGNFRNFHISLIDVQLYLVLHQPLIHSRACSFKEKSFVKANTEFLQSRDTLV